MALLVRSVVRVPEASPAGVSRAARGLRRRHTSSAAERNAPRVRCVSV